VSKNQENNRADAARRGPLALRGWLAWLCVLAAMGATGASAAEQDAEPAAHATQDSDVQDAETQAADAPASSAYAHFVKAMALLRTREVDEAALELKKVVELDPTAAPAWFHLASINRQLGRHKEAVEQYAKAVELKPDDYRYHFELGRVHFLLGNAEEGLRQWELSAECAGDSAAFVYEKIAAHYEKAKEMEKAIATLDKAMRAGDDPAELAERLALMQAKAGNLDDAIGTYRFLLKQQPNENKIRLKIASYYEKQRKWKEALAEYEAFLEKDPPEVRTYAILMQAIEIARRAGETEKMDAYVKQSVGVIDKALAAGEHSPAVYSRLAALLARTGETAKAIDVLKDSLKKASDRQAIDIHIILADVYLLDCRPDDAESEILAAMALDPKSDIIRGKLGSFYMTAMRYAEAVESFRRAVDLTGASERAVYRAALAEAYAELKEYGKSEEQLLAILKDNADESRMWAALAKLRKTAGRFKESIEAAEKALSIGPENPLIETQWRVILAEAYAGLKQPDDEKRQFDAITALVKEPELAVQVGYMLFELRHEKQAAALIESNFDKIPPQQKPAARSILSRIYARSGDLARAEKELDELVRENPDDSSVCREKAQFLIEHERFDEARKLIDAASRLDKDPDEALLSKLAEASLLDEMGNAEEAEQKYAALLDEHPDKPITNNNFSYFYAVRGRDLDAALQMVKKALRVEPDVAAYIDTLGWVLYRKGEYKAAVLKLNEAFQKQPAAEVADHLGDALMKSGQKELAIEKWKKALELDPNAKEIAKKIEDALKADATKQ